ncbi:MAG: hypothetical protein HRT72_01640 [Flavobacteriales bacterium]|nr:hypothetical protein [Flavobacteriales bacterium]
MKKPKTASALILDTLKEKTLTKLTVYSKLEDVFKGFKSQLETSAEDLGSRANKIDEKLTIKYKAKGSYEAEIKIGGDIIVFQMHTNAFLFDKDHHIWNTSYVKDDHLRSYCGIINVYNFLADSFKYQRLNDSGYLVARIFVNKDGHYFVEGKRQMGILFNDFVNSKIKKKDIKDIVESAILYCINFDLYVPDYDEVEEVSLKDIVDSIFKMNLKTSKRLGFKMKTDGNIKS